MQRSSYWYRLFIALDRLLNVLLLNGEAEQSISQHSADAEKAHARWGCLLCRWLSMTVEHDHCQRTLAGLAISPRGGLVAAIEMLAVCAVITAVAHGLIDTSAALAWQGLRHCIVTVQGSLAAALPSFGEAGRKFLGG